MSAATQILASRDFVTAGGTETFLLFQQGFELREFCAFEIYEHEDELAKLEDAYLKPIFEAAAATGAGLLLDSLIWRASPDYIAMLGYKPADLSRINRTAIERTKETATRWAEQRGLSQAEFPALVTADIGPRGDGYKCAAADLDPAAARDYHKRQLETLAGTQADIVVGLTMTSASEAIGIVQASDDVGLPVIISATVEIDGRLPDGSLLSSFVERVDDATSGAPAFYMVNCAHPTHLRPTLQAARDNDEAWLRRLKGFRANASRLSHEQLDNSTELDRGDPGELAAEVADLKRSFGLNVVGGCCGTDHEHIAAIARATAT